MRTRDRDTFIHFATVLAGGTLGILLGWAVIFLLTP